MQIIQVVPGQRFSGIVYPWRRRSIRRGKHFLKFFIEIIKGESRDTKHWRGAAVVLDTKFRIPACLLPGWPGSKGQSAQTDRSLAVPQPIGQPGRFCLSLPCLFVTALLLLTRLLRHFLWSFFSCPPLPFCVFLSQVIHPAVCCFFSYRGTYW